MGLKEEFAGARAEFALCRSTRNSNRSSSCF